MIDPSPRWDLLGHGFAQTRAPKPWHPNCRVRVFKSSANSECYGCCVSPGEPWRPGERLRHKHLENTVVNRGIKDSPCRAQNSWTEKHHGNQMCAKGVKDKKEAAFKKRKQTTKTTKKTTSGCPKVPEIFPQILCF